MMEWYLPMTFLPGVGLIIMSTSNLLNALSSELSDLIKENNRSLDTVVREKIKQLGRLNKSLVSLYVSSASYVLAGLTGTLLTSSKTFESLQIALMILGTLSILLALLLLTQYSIKAVSIKRDQFECRLRLNEKAPTEVEA